MKISQILTPEQTLCKIEGVSKKRALEILANNISEQIPEINADELLRCFIARERLGSTGVGHGIAIPHCRLAECTGILGALITLKEPVDFDAIDNEPVDIIFAILVPAEANDEHLQTLSFLAQALNKDAFRAQLRSAHDAQSLFDIATQQSE